MGDAGGTGGGKGGVGSGVCSVVEHDDTFGRTAAKSRVGDGTWPCRRWATGSSPRPPWHDPQSHRPPRDSMTNRRGGQRRAPLIIRVAFSPASPQRFPRGQLPCTGTAAEPKPVVREGGLRVVVAANSVALLPPGTPIAFAAHPFATAPSLPRSRVNSVTMRSVSPRFWRRSTIAWAR